jgi:hypothetical protein
MEREPARRYRAVGEGVFSSVFRKFKSPILGGKRALFAYFFLKSKIALLDITYNYTYKWSWNLE